MKYGMDGKLRQKLEEKIQEVISDKDEMRNIALSLTTIKSPKDFVSGMAVGRIYNSFYYQTRRILNRNPTEQELHEFVVMIKNLPLEWRVHHCILWISAFLLS